MIANYRWLGNGLPPPLPPTLPPSAAAASGKWGTRLFAPTLRPADDSMAILAAFNSPEVEVLGLTSIYGNVPTAMATRNALTLCHLAGRPEVLAGRRLAD